MASSNYKDVLYKTLEYTKEFPSGAKKFKLFNIENSDYRIGTHVILENKTKKKATFYFEIDSSGTFKLLNGSSNFESQTSDNPFAISLKINKTELGSIVYLETKENVFFVTTKKEIFYGITGKEITDIVTSVPSSSKILISNYDFSFPNIINGTKLNLNNPNKDKVLIVGGTTEIDNNLHISGKVDIDGNLSTNKDMSVADNITVNANLNTGNAIIKNTLNVVNANTNHLDSCTNMTVKNQLTTKDETISASLSAVTVTANHVDSCTGMKILDQLTTKDETISASLSAVTVTANHVDSCTGMKVNNQLNAENTDVTNNLITSTLTANHLDSCTNIKVNDQLIAENTTISASLSAVTVTANHVDSCVNMTINTASVNKASINNLNVNQTLDANDLNFIEKSTVEEAKVTGATIENLTARRMNMDSLLTVTSKTTIDQLEDNIVNNDEGKYGIQFGKAGNVVKGIVSEAFTNIALTNDELDNLKNNASTDTRLMVSWIGNVPEGVSLSLDNLPESADISNRYINIKDTKLGFTAKLLYIESHSMTAKKDKYPEGVYGAFIENLGLHVYLSLGTISDGLLTYSKNSNIGYETQEYNFKWSATIYDLPTLTNGEVTIDPDENITGRSIKFSTNTNIDFVNRKFKDGTRNPLLLALAIDKITRESTETKKLFNISGSSSVGITSGAAPVLNFDTGKNLVTINKANCLSDKNIFLLIYISEYDGSTSLPKKINIAHRYRDAKEFIIIEDVYDFKHKKWNMPVINITNMYSIQNPIESEDVKYPLIVSYYGHAVLEKETNVKTRLFALMSSALGAENEYLITASTLNNIMNNSGEVGNHVSNLYKIGEVENRVLYQQNNSTTSMVEKPRSLDIENTNPVDSENVYLLSQKITDFKSYIPKLSIKLLTSATADEDIIKLKSENITGPENTNKRLENVIANISYVKKLLKGYALTYCGEAIVNKSGHIKKSDGSIPKIGNIMMYSEKESKKIFYKEVIIDEKLGTKDYLSTGDIIITLLDSNSSENTGKFIIIKAGDRLLSDETTPILNPIIDTKKISNKGKLAAFSNDFTAKIDNIGSSNSKAANISLYENGISIGETVKDLYNPSTNRKSTNNMSGISTLSATNVLANSLIESPKILVDTIGNGEDKVNIENGISTKEVNVDIINAYTDQGTIEINNPLKITSESVVASVATITTKNIKVSNDISTSTLSVSDTANVKDLKVNNILGVNKSVVNLCESISANSENININGLNTVTTKNLGTLTTPTEVGRISDIYSTNITTSNITTSNGVINTLLTLSDSSGLTLNDNVNVVMTNVNLNANINDGATINVGANANININSHENIKSVTVSENSEFKKELKVNTARIREMSSSDQFSNIAVTNGMDFSTGKTISVDNIKVDEIVPRNKQSTPVKLHNIELSTIHGESDNIILSSYDSSLNIGANLNLNIDMSSASNNLNIVSGNLNIANNDISMSSSTNIDLSSSLDTSITSGTSMNLISNTNIILAPAGSSGDNISITDKSIDASKFALTVDDLNVLGNATIVNTVKEKQSLVISDPIIELGAVRDGKHIVSSDSTDIGVFSYLIPNAKLLETNKGSTNFDLYANKVKIMDIPSWHEASLKNLGNKLAHGGFYGPTIFHDPETGRIIASAEVSVYAFTSDNKKAIVNLATGELASDSGVTRYSLMSNSDGSEVSVGQDASHTKKVYPTRGFYIDNYGISRVGISFAYESSLGDLSDETIKLDLLQAKAGINDTQPILTKNSDIDTSLSNASVVNSENGVLLGYNTARKYMSVYSDSSNGIGFDSGKIFANLSSYDNLGTIKINDDGGKTLSVDSGVLSFNPSPELTFVTTSNGAKFGTGCNIDENGIISYNSSDADTSWSEAYNLSKIKMLDNGTESAYDSLAGIKTKSGGWAISKYNAGDYINDLLFIYVTDDDSSPKHKIISFKEDSGIQSEYISTTNSYSKTYTGDSFVKNKANANDVLMGDGSTLPITASNTSNPTSLKGSILYLASDGVTEMGRYLDLHTGDRDSDYDTRIECSNSDEASNTLTLPKSSGTVALTSDIKNATLTIKQNGTSKGTFTANQSTDKEIELTDKYHSTGSWSDVTYTATNNGTDCPELAFTIPDVYVKNTGDEMTGLLYINKYSASNAGLVFNNAGSYWVGLGNAGSDVFKLGPCSNSSGTWESNHSTLKFKIDGSTTIDGSLNVDSVTAGNYYATSDYRLKENIRPANVDALAIINNLKTYIFNYKKDETKQDTYGIIAQDIEKTNIDGFSFVNKDEEGYLSIKENRMIYLLLDAIKQQNEIINKLEERLSKLEKDKK